MPVDLPDDPDAEMVALLTKHQQDLQLYVASLMPGNPQAADIAQLANTTIWKKREDFEPGTNFKAWIFAIARYEVLGFRKRQARDARLIFSDELEDIFAEEMPELESDLVDHRQALQHCLEKLKPAQRELIQHRYFLRTPLKNYAEDIGRSASALKVSLHRIRQNLAQCIQRQLATGSR